MERVTIIVSGQVQGVGFRWWTRAKALELGLLGHARNLPDGRVEVVAQGSRADLDRLVRLLEEQSSGTDRPGRVTGVATEWAGPGPGGSGFLAT